MKVVVVGGTGTIGSGVAKQLAKEKDVEWVHLTSRSLDKAKEAAKKIGNKVSGVELDIFKKDQLAKVVKKADVVVNCSGPYHKVAIPVISTIVEQGVNYIDIMDDPDAMIKVLDDSKFHKKAKDAGVTVIVGLGSTPGLSDILGKYGATKLEKVDRIDVTWAFTSVSGTGAGGALSEHLLHVMDRGWTYKDGKWVETKPLVDGKDTQDFLQLGRLDVYDIGHPEPIMLPRHVKGVKAVTCKTGMIPSEMIQTYRTLTELGLLGLTPVDIKGTSITPREFMLKQLPTVPMETFVKLFKLDEIEPIFELRVAVDGEKEGEEASFIYNFVDVSHEEATVVPTALGALWLGRGQVKIKGLLPPEGCIDSERFLKEVVENGVVIYESYKGKRELFKP